MKCAECLFWRALDGKTFVVPGELGACHRYAPSAQTLTTAQVIGALYNTFAGTVREDGDATAGTASAIDRQALWPTTAKSDFCGDYSPAKKANFV